MCDDCHGPHKHYHWLTFRTMQVLADHLRMLTHRDDQVQSICDWYLDTIALYKDTASPITGAPMSVAEAWRNAQWVAAKTSYTIADTRDEREAIRTYYTTHDPKSSDVQVMRAALREIRQALDTWGEMPTQPPQHTAREI